jgi:phosphatidylinositol alpha-1,6-mannosyltransferase
MNTDTKTDDKPHPRTLVVTSDFPKIGGGISRMVFGVCNSIKNIEVLAPTENADEQFDRTLKYPVHRADFHFRTKGIVGQILAIRRLKKQITRLIDNNDIIVCGNILPIGYVASKFNKQYILLAYGNDVLQPQKSSVKKRMMQTAVKNASKIIAISNFTKEALIEAGVPASKIEVIPPGIDTKIFKYNAKAAKELRQTRLGSRKVILSVGRLVERKGHDRVIRALPKILQNLPDVRYYIIGDGPYKQTLERIAEEEGVKDKIVFLEGLSDEQMLAYYSACDVFVMPSRYIKEKGDAEGFGIVALLSPTEADPLGKSVLDGAALLFKPFCFCAGTE